MPASPLPPLRVSSPLEALQMTQPFDVATFRLLNACEACGRQYDVSHLEHGAPVRCECGERFHVRVQTPHSPRALCCSGCGASVAADARSCAYCSAEITLEERRLTAVCPKCFARTGREARHCMECGLALSPQALFALREGVHCPRCKGGLHGRGVANGSLVECGRCGGMWLGHEDFVRLCESAESESLAEQFHVVQPSAPAQSSSTASYVPCVVCREFMNRRNYASASGVVMDVCKAHGVWLDHGEIDKILSFIRGGGLERARRRQIEKLEDERRRLRAERAAATGSYDPRLDSGRVFGEGRAAAGQIGLGVFLDWLF
jgi:Zn-finger nucleic acid-binding protein/DNA-directed RNA polymerase subunit RPC12/RpoP